MTLSNETIKIIKSTAPVLEVHGATITTVFYKKIQVLFYIFYIFLHLIKCKVNPYFQFFLIHLNMFDIQY